MVTGRQWCGVSECSVVVPRRSKVPSSWRVLMAVAFGPEWEAVVAGHGMERCPQRALIHAASPVGPYAK